MSGNISTISSSFSFRMFDLYRRFVEILRLNPEFLSEFKTGNPPAETCRQIAIRSYQHRQPENRIVNLALYLKSNAKAIAKHTENKPDNWEDAIKYTNGCIKLVKKILNLKGIAVRTFDPDQFFMDQLVRDIANVMHNDQPNDIQLTAIKDYLLYDLKNPKKTIVSSTPKTLKSRKKEASKKNKTDNFLAKQNKTKELKMKIKKVSRKSLQINKSPCNNASANLVYETELKQEVPTSSNESEEYSTISCDPVSRKLMQLGVVKSDDKPVYDLANNFSDNWTESVYKIPRNSYEQTNFIATIKKDADDVSYDVNESLIKDEVMTEHYNVENEPVDKMKNSKRQVTFNEHDYSDNSGVKKFIIDSPCNIQNSHCANNTENTCNGISKFQTMMEPVIEVTETNEVINVGNISKREVDILNACQVEEIYPLKVQDDQKAKHELLYSKTDEVEPLKEIEMIPLNQIKYTFKNNVFKQESHKEDSICSPQSRLYDSTCSSFISLKDDKNFEENVSFSEIEKIIANVKAFCDKKPNEISIEEFLHLRRFHDKILLMRLKEQKIKITS